MGGTGIVIARRVAAVALCAVLLPLFGSDRAAAAPGGAATRVLTKDVPSLLSRGAAKVTGLVDPASDVDINVGLQLRNAGELDALIRASSTPGSPSYGHFLTPAEAQARFAPTSDQVAAVVAWLRGKGLKVGKVAPENLIVHARGDAATVERAFGVTLRRYLYKGKAYRASALPPAVPSGLDIGSVTGLSDLPSAQTLDAVHSPGYTGADVRKSYGVTGDGSGQTLGLVLYGSPIPQAWLDEYATRTNSSRLVIGKPGDDGVDFVPAPEFGDPTGTKDEIEMALDTEIAHTVAPGLHETFFVGRDNSLESLENVIVAAYNDFDIKVFSDSFTCLDCDESTVIEEAFTFAASEGRTFLFGSGDNGALSADAQRRVSPYQFMVGGTEPINFDGYSADEMAWDQGGGGCNNDVDRPAWQVGLPTTYTFSDPSDPSTEVVCTGRAIPDVSAIANSVDVVDENGFHPQRGTSVATPVWAATVLAWKNDLDRSGRPEFGYLGPLIYQLANFPPAGADDFHDITQNGNFFPAAPGWDEATGWGTPNYPNLTDHPLNISYTGDTSATSGEPITLKATMTIPQVTRGGPDVPWPLNGQMIFFAGPALACAAAIDNDGTASCSFTPVAKGTYKLTAHFPGTTSFGAADGTDTLTVNPRPTKLTYTGATSGRPGETVTLSARLTDVLTGDPVNEEKIALGFAGDSCFASTGPDGRMSCPVTITAGADASPYTLNADFGGDNIYAPAHDSATFTVNRYPTALTYTGTTASVYPHTITLSARLSESETDAGISGQHVLFTLSDGTTCSPTTDPQGNASCHIVPAHAGDFTVQAAFAQTDVYKASDASAAIHVAQGTTTLAFHVPAQLANDYPAAFSGTLRNEDGTPLSGKTVTFTVSSPGAVQSCSGTTQSGAVSCTIPKLAQSTTATSVTISAAFAGDGDYIGTQSTTTAPLLYYVARAYGASFGSPTPYYYADTGLVQTASQSSAQQQLLSLQLGLISITGLNASRSTGLGTATATASDASATILSALGPLIGATGVTATSTSTCSGSHASTTIASLRLAGVLSSDTHPAPNSHLTIAGVRITLNEQLPTDHGLTVNGIHITYPDGTGLVLASARSEIHNCAAGP